MSTSLLFSIVWLKCSGGDESSSTSLIAAWKKKFQQVPVVMQEGEKLHFLTSPLLYIYWRYGEQASLQMSTWKQVAFYSVGLTFRKMLVGTQPHSILCPPFYVIMLFLFKRKVLTTNCGAVANAIQLRTHKSWLPVEDQRARSYFSSNLPFIFLILTIFISFPVFVFTNWAISFFCSV